MAASMEQHGIDHANKGEELLKLKQTLDELFEQYLNLLDQYQTTRQQLSAQLSSVRKSNSE
jgi:vacuolar-type H+-ATPase subunit D/Vma8